MASTALIDFSASVGAFLVEQIFPAITAGLEARGVRVTPQELLDMTKVPQTPAFGGAVVPAPPSRAKAKAASRAKAKAAPAQAAQAALPTPPPAEASGAEGTGEQSAGCMYRMQKGKKANSLCGKARVPGDTLCKTHGERKPARAEPAPPPSTLPAPEIELNVDIFDEKRGLFSDAQHGFIVFEEEGRIKAVGKLLEPGNPANKTVVPLSDSDKALASTYGIIVVADDAKIQRVLYGAAAPAAN